MQHGQDRHLKDVAISGQTKAQDWRWALGEIWTRQDPQKTDKIDLIIPSPQSFRSQGQLGYGTLDIWPTNLTGSISIDEDNRPQEVALNGTDLTIVGPDFQSFISHLDMRIAKEPDGARTIALELASIAVPEFIDVPEGMGRTIQKALLTFRLEGATHSPISAADWQARNGRVSITALEVDWGTFHLDLSGRGYLDDLLRPQGQFVVKLEGLEDGLAAAETFGWLSSRQAKPIIEGVRQLAKLRQQADPDFTLTFTMGGGYLNWAGLPIMRLPSFAEASN